MEDAERFLRAVDAAIAGRDDEPALIAPGEGVLVACSGGPDSTALVHALAALEARSRRGWRLEVAHVHHGLRGAEADLDRDCAAGTAAGLGLPFHVKHVSIAELREAAGGSEEEAGRRARYRFFEETARARGLTKVAVAHHRDDRIETVLQRILRGTGVRGLAGIPRRRRLGGPDGPDVIRPFLGLGREEVRAYLAAIGAAARQDWTNESPARAFRNRIRLEVLPYLRGVAPQVDVSLERLARAAEQAGEVIEGDVSRRLDAAGVAPRIPLRVPLALVRETPPPLRTILLLRAVERATGAQLLWAHGEGLLGLALAPGAGAGVDLPGGLRAERRYQEIVVDRPTGAGQAAAAIEVPILVGARTDAPELGVAVEARVLRHEEGAPAAPPGGRSARFDFASLAGPLALRRPRAGDFFYPAGGRGRKKLQDFFVDAKVPRAERPQALVLDAGGEVAWIVGFRQDARFVVNEGTYEALEVRVEPL
jgi:tRNA(Ile)-lysidine synthetase-like protein